MNQRNPSGFPPELHTPHSTLHTEPSVLSNAANVSPKPLSLYVHIPFCASKCAYCDFASYPGREGDWDGYFRALWSELEGWGPALSGREIETVFFGGGTPTLVDAGYVVETLERARALAGFAAGAEVTLEGNPGTLTPGKLDACRRAGVNRLSLGAQSLDDGLLRALGRIHTAAQVNEAVAMARDAGLGNINLDLMYALPGQDMDRWLDTLDGAVAMKVAHISAYSLIVEPGTPMAAWVASGAVRVPDDETVNRMQRAATARLEAAGYGRYEISNYARSGFECRHNLVYWRRGDYLGLGCAAHSFLDGRRFHNPPGLDTYLAGERAVDDGAVTRTDAMDEALMLETRTVRGLDLRAWERDFGVPFERGRERTIQRLVDAGLAEIDEGWFRLTECGLEVQDAAVGELM